MVCLEAQVALLRFVFNGGKIAREFTSLFIEGKEFCKHNPLIFLSFLSGSTLI